MSKAKDEWDMLDRPSKKDFAVNFLAAAAIGGIQLLELLRLRRSHKNQGPIISTQVADNPVVDTGFQP